MRRLQGVSKRWMARGAWVLLGCALLGVAWARLRSDPRIPLLAPEGGAEWIYSERPYLLTTPTVWRERFTFRSHFVVTEKPSSAILVLHAFRAAAVSVDGKFVLEPAGTLAEWKLARKVDLAPSIEPGVHEIRIEAFNENGPAAVLAYSDALGIHTGRGWEVSYDGASWTEAGLARAARHVAVFDAVPRTDQSLLALLPVHLAVFAVVALFLSFWRSWTARIPGLDRLTPTPARFRWALLASWGVLAANNILKTPINLGFDALDHLSYIRHVAENWRIPLANEGWQMFQSPLYYVVSAPLDRLLAMCFPPAVAAQLLRIVPLLCGAAQVELCYRALRRVFPGREDLQMAGTAVGGLLPFNLYLSQGLGNEPMAGLFSAATIVAALSLLDAGAGSWKRLVVVGLLLGLALLSKVTAVLLIPPILVFSFVALRTTGQRFRRAAAGAALVLLVVVLVAGWYYLRNWIALGRPFLGGWDLGRGIAWSQEPGYRTPDDFLRFGESLVRPVYAATVGFWDGLYSTFWADGYLSNSIDLRLAPPWNYDFMLSVTLLSVVPCALILLGCAVGFRMVPSSGRKALLLSTGSAAIYLAALLYIFLTLPIYSTVKATYTAGLLPCYALLAMAGLERLTRRKVPRVVLHSFLASWAVASYASYFVN